MLNHRNNVLVIPLIIILVSIFSFTKSGSFFSYVSEYIFIQFVECYWTFLQFLHICPACANHRWSDAMALNQFTWQYLKLSNEQRNLKKSIISWDIISASLDATHDSSNAAIMQICNIKFILTETVSITSHGCSLTSLSFGWYTAKKTWVLSQSTSITGNSTMVEYQSIMCQMILQCFVANQLTNCFPYQQRCDKSDPYYLQVKKLLIK